MAKKSNGHGRGGSDPRDSRLGRSPLSPGITIRSLEIFVAVATTGTMVAAAKQLQLTQPAVSQVVATLEASLGIQLFDRSVRPPALSDGG